MWILLFVLKYMYISLLLKMINGFSWPAKIMVSPFNTNELSKKSTELPSLQKKEILCNKSLKPKTLKSRFLLLCGSYQTKRQTYY